MKSRRACFAVLYGVRISLYALEMSVIRPETGVGSQSWSGLSGTAASGQGKGMKCFLAAAGGHQRAKNRQHLSLCLL